MCELFGISSPVKIHCNKLLKEFYSHCIEHPDGWGLAVFDNHEVSIEKEPVKADNSLYLKERLSEDITACHLLAHIRLATIGTNLYKNCHPYTGRDITDRRWTLIHNGTVFKCSFLNKYTSLQKGDTDSERILLCLLERINTAAKDGVILNQQKRFDIVNKLITDIANGGNNKLNLIIFDGEILYIHTNYADSLYTAPYGNGTIFSTKPLTKTLPDSEWTPLPMNTVHGYCNGKETFRGQNHGRECNITTEDMKYIYLNYALL